MRIKKASTQRLLNKFNQLLHDKLHDHRVYHLIGAIRKRPEIGYAARQTERCIKRG